MFKRKQSGSVLCPSCGKLVGINDSECLNCGRRNPGMWGLAPVFQRLGKNLGFTSLVTWGCAALYVASLLVDPEGIQNRGISIMSPSGESVVVFGASGWVPVFYYGKWWTVLSAGWLHGSLIHILFNMLWIRQLCPATSELYGTSRTVIIYTASSVAGFLLSSCAGLLSNYMPIPGTGYYSIGASASVFGLLGALVFYGRRGGSSYIGNQAKTYAILLFVFALFMSRVDNYGHLGGFLGGYLAARWLDPLLPERTNHMVIAIICLALTALSILASVLTAGDFLR